MQNIEWMNKYAQDAKRCGDYETFEYWRRAYLNAQAAARREEETLDREGEVEYNEGS